MELEELFSFLFFILEEEWGAKDIQLNYRLVFGIK